MPLADHIALPVVDGDTEDGTATVYGFAQTAAKALLVAEPYFVDGVSAAYRGGKVVTDENETYTACWVVLSGAYEGDIPADAVRPDAKPAGAKPADAAIRAAFIRQFFADGGTIGEALNLIGLHQREREPELVAKYVALARATDDLEIDDNPVVSAGADAGAFVLSWQWVADPDHSPTYVAVQDDAGAWWIGEAVAADDGVVTPEQGPFPNEAAAQHAADAANAAAA